MVPCGSPSCYPLRGRYLESPSQRKNQLTGSGDAQHRYVSSLTEASSPGAAVAASSATSAARTSAAKART